MSTTDPDEPGQTPVLGESILPGPPDSDTQVGDQDAPPPQVAATLPLRPTSPGYEVDGEIARGGMGAILAAREVTLEREVAIKVLLPEVAADAARRFVTESKITARLQHPSIPPVYSLGELPDGSPFLAMKLIRGRTLASMLAEGPVSSVDLAWFVGIFEKVCEAVAYAHTQRIIHRDLKPQNVMVGAFGEVQVMDWGLAKDLVNPTSHGTNEMTAIYSTPGEAGSSPPSVAGAVLGTPAYMAPEQARGESVDERSDVFALGGILCTILTGHAPFEGGDARLTLGMAAMGAVSVALNRLSACDTDAELVRLASRCLSADPADRPADAGVLATEIAAYRASIEERLRAAETARAMAEAQVDELRQWGRLQLGVAAGVLLVAGLVVALLWSGDRRQARRDADRRVEQAVQEALRQAEANAIEPAPETNGDAIPPPREVKQ